MPSRTAASVGCPGGICDICQRGTAPAANRAFHFQRNPTHGSELQWRYLSHPNFSTLARLDTAFERRSWRFSGFPAMRHAQRPRFDPTPQTQTSGSASVKLPTRTLNGRSKQLLMCADLSEPPADPKAAIPRNPSATSGAPPGRISPYRGPRPPRLTFGTRHAPEWHV